MTTTLGPARHTIDARRPDHAAMQALRRLAALPILALVVGCSGSGASPAPPSPTAGPTTAATGAPSATPEPPSAQPSPTAIPSEPAGPPRWSALAPAGDAPPAREDHTLTADGGDAAWLFGGRDGGETFDDLWRYDLAGDAWTRVEPDGARPAARFGHTGTWVDGIGLVIWSGQAGSSFFADLWAYDPTANRWTELPPGGDAPPARYGSCAALAPDGRLWVSHGFTADGRFDDTRAYDFTTSTWSDESADGPVIRCLHDCLFAPDGDLVLYAGQTNGQPAIGDLWTRTAGGGWQQAEPAGPAPAPRQLYAIAAIDGRAWVFGGGGADGAKLADLWVLDLETLAWRQVDAEGDAPSARSGASLVTDAARGRLLLFGGTDGQAASDELVAFVPAG